MNFINPAAKTNWKYILIIVVAALLAGVISAWQKIPSTFRFLPPK